jgi:hypothetical protein
VKLLSRYFCKACKRAMLFSIYKGDLSKLQATVSGVLFLEGDGAVNAIFWSLRPCQVTRCYDRVSEKGSPCSNIVKSRTVQRQALTTHKVDGFFVLIVFRTKSLLLLTASCCSDRHYPMFAHVCTRGCKHSAKVRIRYKKTASPISSGTSPLYFKS